MRYLFIFLAFVITLTGSKAQWKPGDDITDERDGQIYKTVKIGNQTWLKENMNIGNLIPTTKAGYEMSDNQIIEKYCWDNDEGNCDGSGGVMKRGGFYEWKEAVQYWEGQPALPVQGICPVGWHIPSNSEWNELLGFLGGANAYLNMLEGSESGFDALLTGYRCTQSGLFRASAMSADTRTYFWTAEQTDADNVPLIELGASSLTSFSYLKSLGLCVRCIMNETNGMEDQENYEGDLKLEINPNPFNSETTIKYKLNGNSSENINIIIIDVLGNIVAQPVNEMIKPGSYQYKFENNELSTGTYFVIAKAGNFITQIPLFILK